MIDDIDTILEMHVNTHINRVKPKVPVISLQEIKKEILQEHSENDLPLLTIKKEIHKDDIVITNSKTERSNRLPTLEELLNNIKTEINNECDNEKKNNETKINKNVQNIIKKEKRHLGETEIESSEVLDKKRRRMDLKDSTVTADNNVSDRKLSSYSLVYTTRLDEMCILKRELKEMEANMILKEICRESKPLFSYFSNLWQSSTKIKFEILKEKLAILNNKINKLKKNPILLSFLKHSFFRKPSPPAGGRIVSPDIFSENSSKQISDSYIDLTTDISVNNEDMFNEISNENICDTLPNKVDYVPFASKPTAPVNGIIIPPDIFNEKFTEEFSDAYFDMAIGTSATSKDTSSISNNINICNSLTNKIDDYYIPFTIEFVYLPHLISVEQIRGRDKEFIKSLNRFLDVFNACSARNTCSCESEKCITYKKSHRDATFSKDSNIMKNNIHEELQIENTTLRDNKLFMYPIVYTTKIEDMLVLRHKEKIFGDNVLEAAWRESKPTFNNFIKKHNKCDSYKLVNDKKIKYTIINQSSKSTNKIFDLSPCENSVYNCFIQNKDIIVDVRRNIVILIEDIKSNITEVYDVDGTGKVTNIFYCDPSQLNSLNGFAPQKPRMKLSTCCWFNRADRIHFTWDDSSSDILKFVRKPHLCPLKSCHCCCKLKRSDILNRLKSLKKTAENKDNFDDTLRELILEASKSNVLGNVDYNVCVNNILNGASSKSDLLGSNPLNGTKAENKEPELSKYMNCQNLKIGPVFSLQKKCQEFSEVPSRDKTPNNLEHLNGPVETKECIDNSALNNLIEKKRISIVEESKNLDQTKLPNVEFIDISEDSNDFKINSNENSNKIVNAMYLTDQLTHKNNILNNATPAASPDLQGNVQLVVSCRQLPGRFITMDGIDPLIAGSILSRVPFIRFYLKNDGQIVAHFDASTRMTGTEEILIFVKIMKKVEDMIKTESLPNVSEINLTIKRNLKAPATRVKSPSNPLGKLVSQDKKTYQTTFESYLKDGPKYFVKRQPKKTLLKTISNSENNNNNINYNKSNKEISPTTLFPTPQVINEMYLKNGETQCKKQISNNAISPLNSNYQEHSKTVKSNNTAKDCLLKSLLSSTSTFNTHDTSFLKYEIS